MSTKCPKCQFDNTADSKFCKECGIQLIPVKGPYTSKTMTLETPAESLSRGTLFAGRYEIIEELGKGGMGKVYRAFDKELKEEVALKLIKPEIASDKKTIERFSNELKIARKVVHKNVGRMYELMEAQGTRFITMEYVPGEDLKSLIRRVKQLTVGTAISIAKQVCEGLSEAHRLEVIHRDLKPSNIMIDQEGNARIMDFGIARSLQSKGITGEGVMIGTPEYMSPEQVEGSEVDHGSDIYSLGVILYEMVTGRVPFEGDTPISIAMKHKSETPPEPKKFNTQMPSDLNQMILRCLEKDKESRYQSAEAVANELARIEKGIPTPERVVPKKKPVTSKEITLAFGLKKLFIPALALIALAVVIILSVFLINKLSIKEAVLPMHRQLTFTGNAHYPAISPDGKFIAYINLESFDEQKVIVKDMLSGQTLEVFSGKRCGNLKWLPDGSELSFTLHKKDNQFAVIAVPRLGGSHRQFDARPIYAWSPDGSQIAHADFSWKKILLTDRSTDESASISLKGSFTWMNELDWSPSGHLLLFLTTDKERQILWTITVDGSQQHKVLEDVGLRSPRWSPQGNAIFYLRISGQAKELWKIPIDPDAGKPSKSPALVLTGLQAGLDFTITNDGKKMLYTQQLNYSNLWQATVEGSGKGQIVKTKQITKGTLWNWAPSISPDGGSVAFVRGNRETADIYVIPVERDISRQITFLNYYCFSPVWSPDGKEIAFGSTKGGTPRVWKVGIEGGKPHQFTESNGSESMELSWSPGQQILYQQPGNRNFILLDTATGAQTPLVKNESAGWIFGPRYSPDGKKVAVMWNRPPSYRGLCVIFLEDTSHVFLREGSLYPIRWSSDGKWIYFSEQQPGSLRIIMVDSKSRQEKIVLNLPFTMEIGNIDWRFVSMSPDGRHIVFSADKTQSDVWIIENFDSEKK